MQMNKEPYGTGAAMDSVYHKLNLLQCGFSERLEHESLDSQVALLKSLIEDFRRGDSAAADALHEFGSDLLKAIKERIEAAVAEEERMIEESPTAARFGNGRRAHETSRAAALLAEAEEILNTSLREELTY